MTKSDVCVTYFFLLAFDPSGISCQRQRKSRSVYGKSMFFPGTTGRPVVAGHSCLLRQCGIIDHSKILAWPERMEQSGTN